MHAVYPKRKSPSADWISSPNRCLVLGREISSGGGTLIPVWWNVTQSDVAERSPILADRKAIVSDGDIRKLGSQIFHRAIGLHVPIDPLGPMSGTQATGGRHRGARLAAELKEYGVSRC